MRTPSDRARFYRDEAVKLRAMAKRKPQGGRVSKQLVGLASEYDRLADRAEGKELPSRHTGRRAGALETH